ncbi:multicopper oxidase family protein [Nocardia neocaledoniensis]|uniref:multicopper oxidase family protein n=1 Tax=Nocardia neocaledoniensis TaxID=236511 RepID=UPI002454CE21|nr:multicopper oxidase family protein [Nocardia neocaledoniensis]
MSTAAWIVLDHAVTVAGASAWFGAAGLVARRRSARFVGVMLSVAVALTLSRGIPVAVLAGRGWWFVQEKVWFGLPVTAVAAVVAVSARRGAGPAAGTVTALATAGYAAVASFAVSFLIGYPLTPVAALVALVALGTAALLTRRVLSEPVAPERDSTAQSHAGPRPKDGARPAGMPRRRALGLAGAVAVVGAAGGVVGRSRGRDVAGIEHAQGPEISVRTLRGPDAPAPGGVLRRYVRTARKATVRVGSGDVEAWTFDGTVPGPAIVAEQGDLVEVELVNEDIDVGVTLHWHGYDVPCAEDGAAGVTQDAVPVGGSHVYRFRAEQAGTYWYHTHHASHPGVRRGLYGHLIVTPRAAPTDRRELTMSVHTFDGHAPLLDGGGDHDVPAGATTRLRLINTDSGSHRFALAGTDFRVVAVDGRDLDRPTSVGGVQLRVPAGGRYDLEFTMPAAGAIVQLDGDSAARLGAENDYPAAGSDVRDWPDLDLLTYGAAPPVRLPAPDRRFTLVLDRGIARVNGRPSLAHTVNGRAHPAIPDQVVRAGDLVHFTVVNRSLDTHPWHLHGHPVLILSRDGEPAQGSPLWVDSLDVRPGEVWEIAFRATNPGIWMNHCHNLPHAEEGMMLLLRYTGIGTPFGGSHTHH